MKQIETFLINNGFEKRSSYSNKGYLINHFQNTECKVVLNYNNGVVVVHLNDEYLGCDLKNEYLVYWLIGCLTYNNLIDKNYKI